MKPTQFLHRHASIVLLAALPILAACGGAGGTNSPLANLYTSISIDKVDRPSTAGTSSDVTVESHANSTGEISGGDIVWHLDQTSGDDVNFVTQTLSDNNHTVKFNFKTPATTSNICFNVKVETSNHNYSDTKSFCIDVR